MDNPKPEGDAGGGNADFVTRTDAPPPAEVTLAGILAELKRMNEPAELIQGEAIRFEGITLRQLSRSLAAHALVVVNHRQVSRGAMDTTALLIEQFARAGDDEPEAVDKGDAAD